jgi:hypothetical protein
MQPPQIVGIVLVRNEDLHIERAVRNAEQFCDRLFLCDHGSQDGTSAILQRFASELRHASFHRLAHPRESHELLKPLCGTDTWVFGVDGDEIYDPAGLAVLKKRLRSGEFAEVWRMKGNVVHVTSLANGAARGFAAPPSRSITKLYNFSAIRAWDGDTVERLHGGRIEFAPGWNDSMKFNLQETTPWEESPLRCLHLCFLPRSSADAGSAARANIMETYGAGWRGWWRRFTGSGRWKREHYRMGPEVTVDASPFFPA